MRFVLAAERPASDVIDILAGVTGQPAARVPTSKLKDLATCDASLRADVATKINKTWPDLLPPFRSSDVKCSDTGDDLEARVASRMQ